MSVKNSGATREQFAEYKRDKEKDGIVQPCDVLSLRVYDSNEAIPPEDNSDPCAVWIVGRHPMTCRILLVDDVSDSDKRTSKSFLWFEVETNNTYPIAETFWAFLPKLIGIEEESE